jgi:hypothetical protein
MKRVCFQKNRPKDCLDEELKNFLRFVLQGGQVRPEGLVERVKRAAWLGFGIVDDVLVSVAAVKVPDDLYRDRVFTNAESVEDKAEFKLEFGWVFTLPAFEGKGLGSGLAHLLLDELSESIFATTSVNNLTMQAILQRRHFYSSGNPFPGRDEEKVLYLRR